MSDWNPRSPIPIADLRRKLRSLDLEGEDDANHAAKNISQPSSSLTRDVELFIKASELERLGNVSQGKQALSRPVTNLIAIKYYKQAYRMNPDVDRLVSSNELLPTLSSKDNGAIALKPKFQVTVPGILEDFIETMRQYQPLGLPSDVWTRILTMVGLMHTISLEECARTCKLFFVLSRHDQQVWKHILMSTWATKGRRLPSISGSGPSPSKTGLPSPITSTYRHPSVTGYRRAYFESPRLRTDGVYICKISYFRPGMTDGAFYQPVHMVTYYRYLRLFPPHQGNHQAILLVSTEEPKKVIDLLRYPIEGPMADYIPFGTAAEQLIATTSGSKRETSSSSKMSSFKQANVFLGRYYRDTPDASLYRLTLFDPQSTRNSLFAMDLAVSKRNTVGICQRYSLISPLSLDDSSPSSSSYDFDVSGWGKFIFSRVRSYIS